MRHAAAENHEMQATDLLSDTAAHVTEIFSTQDQRKYPFHNLKFVIELTDEAREIAEVEITDAQTRERVLLAAWFVYSGYAQGHPAVAEKSKAIAGSFLKKHGYSPAGIDEVFTYMESVHHSTPPEDAGQAVLRDASIAYTAKRKFRKRAKLLREELEALGNETFTESEWTNYLLGLVSSARFFTNYVKVEYTGRHEQNLIDLRTELKDVLSEDSEAKVSRNLEKGIDTLFRTQTRYLFNLVGLADRKAQMIIGVNSISMSILFSTLEDMISSHSHYIFPVALFMTVNLVAMVFAIFVISPTTPKKVIVSQEDVLLKHGSLIAQVMFSEIEYEHFKLGMKQMMSDETYLYDTMIKNMYDTGRVLMKKFSYLRIAYRIFTYGMPTAALSFLVIFLMKLKS